jgi:calcium/calmodulin-dependent protein kinase I
VKDPTGPRKFTEIYTLGKTLGRGGFAVVREAINNQTKELYAVKIIEKKGLKEKDMEVLRREVAIMQKLAHPGIVQLIEVFDEAETVSLVLELVRGGELFDKIVERGFYSERDAAELIRQILTAVEYMHAHGVTHRDLKPENLLCSGEKNEKIKIADFGLSKEGDTLSTSCGSPGYVAPEILLGEEYDNSVDVWSVGVIAYVLLCGYPPFFSDNPGELCQQIISVKYDFPDAEWADISDNAKNFIKQILVQNPSQRMTATECLNHAWIKEASTKQLKSFESVRGNILKHRF